MNAKRILLVGISAATGTCFAVLAALSISVMIAPFRRFQPLAVPIALVSIYLGYRAFRTALQGKTGGVALLASLVRGLVGAFLGLLVSAAFIFLFGYETLGLMAHALGKPASILTDFRLLVASALLGFGAGFVVRMPKAHASGTKP